MPTAPKARPSSPSNSHWPSQCRLFKGQNCTHPATSKDIVWQCRARNRDNPYRVEWDDLLDAIRQDKPYNEVERGAKASLVTAMGRMAAHTGQPSPSTRCSTASTSSRRKSIS